MRPMKLAPFGRFEVNYPNTNGTDGKKTSKKKRQGDSTKPEDYNGWNMSKNGGLLQIIFLEQNG